MVLRGLLHIARILWGAQASRTQLFPSTASTLGLHPHSQSLQDHCSSRQRSSGSLPFGAALAPRATGSVLQRMEVLLSPISSGLQLPWPQSCF